MTPYGVPYRPQTRHSWLAGLLTALALLSMGMGSNKGASEGPLSVEALYAQCGFPLPCDAATPWEGQRATFQGRIDPNNIFDKQHYPQLPYEKFRLVGPSGAVVEIWPKARDNRPIFDKLARRPSDTVIIQGRLAAFRMPTIGQCKMGLKVVIDHADQIQFQTD